MSNKDISQLFVKSLQTQKLKKSIAKIVTNSLEPGEPKDINGCNVFNLYSHFSTTSEQNDFASEYADGISWGDAKNKLFESINKELSPIRERYNKLSQDKIHMLEDIPGWFWDKSEKKKNMSKPEIKPKTKKETNKEKQPRVLSEISELHKKYKVKTSHNLHKYFKENPTKWEEYHKISKDNEESFPEHEIPRNKMIKYLENLPGNKQKIVVDLGCGFAEINHHFKDSKRFVFHNFDHHSGNKLVIARDIKNTELEDYSVDIAILSLAMWGSNCNDYLNEVQRILDVGGTLLIAEGFNRWNKELDKNGNPINKLVELLKEHNFTVVKNEEGKFMFIECRKCNIG